MLEVVIVITIILILGAFAVPWMKPLLESIRLRTTANTIKQHLMVAKTRALGDPNVHAGVYINETAPYSTLPFLDDDETNMNDYSYTAENDHILMPVFRLPTGQTLVKQSGTNPVVFRGDGSAKESIKLYVSINIGGTIKADTISVLASTGRIKLTRN